MIAPHTRRPGAPRSRRAAGPAGLALALIASLVVPLTAAPTAQAAPAAAAATVPALAAAAVTRTPAQALAAGVQQAAARGVRTAAVIADRRTGAVLAATGPDEQFGSASLVKLYTAVYVGLRNPSLKPTLAEMVRTSRDSTQSALWNTSIVPWVSQRYGLTGSVNSSAALAGYWGTVRVTARDLVRLMYRMERDPGVADFLPTAMLQAADAGADGFDQDFGVNALAGAGSKQGWMTIAAYPSTSLWALHSVGFTSRYYIAILQTAPSSVGWATMRATATTTAQLLAASAPPPYPQIPRGQATDYVAALYTRVLGRTGNSAPLIDALVQGRASLAVTARSVAGLAERWGALADAVHRGCLGSAGGREWGARLAAGANFFDVLRNYCGMTAALVAAGGNADRYLTRALTTIWNRAPSAADLASYRVTLRGGSPAAVVERASRDVRFNRGWVQRFSLHFLLHAAPTSSYAVYDRYPARLHGLLDIQVRIASSAEFFDRET